MATGSWPTIVDVASRTDPEGDIPEIAEMMAQCNDYTDDAPYMEANEKTGHEFVFRTSIPAGAWRSYNQGTPYSKSTTAKARVGLGMLTDWSQIDRSLLKHSGQGEKFRRSEDFAFIAARMKSLAADLDMHADPIATICGCNGIGFLRTPELTIAPCRECRLP